MDYATDDQMAELKKLASTRIHRLAPYMVGEGKNQKPLAMPAYEKVVDRLNHSPLKDAPQLSIQPGDQVRLIQDGGWEPIFPHSVSGEFRTEPSPAIPARDEQPRRLPPLVAFKDKVPAGRYAVPSLTGANDLDFFKVDRPDTVRIEGMCFIDQVVGGKEDIPQTNGYRKRMILQAIVDLGVEASAQLFGQQIGSCSECGHHLTDEISRYNGIGPNCAEKVGRVRVEPPAGWAAPAAPWMPRVGPALNLDR